MTTNNDHPTIQTLLASLLSGGSVSFTLSVDPASDGIAFLGKITTPDGHTISPIVPPLIVPPIAPPVVAPPVVPPTIVPIVATPVTNEPAAAFATVTHPIPVPPTLKTPFPHPTNAWWENIIVGKNRIVPEPYQIQIVDNGFLACTPAQFFTKDSFGMEHITTQFLQNASLEFAENKGDWSITNHDDLTITVRWNASTGGSATSVFAQGCPYLTMAYSATTPLFTTQHLILSVNGSTGGGTASKFKITMNNGQTWLLYMSSAVTLTVSANQLLASAPFTGIARLTYLGAPAEEALLDQYVSTIPTAGAVTPTASGYTFSWTTVGSGQLLMCALPHHLDILRSPATTTLIRATIKGPAIGIVGSTWTLTEPQPTITWNAPHPLAEQAKEVIAAQLKKDASFINNSTSDTYFAGKGLAKMARLLLIADQLGDTASVTLITTNLRASLTMWFTQNGLLAYDKTWGGVIFAPSLGDIGSDFGFSYSYNDHVFHLGYFVYAAAVLAKFDAGWSASYGERVTELAHDYCNPAGSGDTRYPTARNKDFYMGHSWASGLVDFGDNRNLESTSEAANGYYGAMLWGEVSGDATLKSYAGLLLAMEIRSAQKYWHTIPGTSVYGSQWTAAGAGLVWSAKIDDSTWFDAHLSCRRGIQVLPVTPIAEALLDVPWVNAIKASGEMTAMLAESFTIWPTFINALLAVTDAATALTNINALADNQIDDGASRTNLLWWIATRP
jgi:endo-1,3(4)-beta-glucanase